MFLFLDPVLLVSLEMPTRSRFPHSRTAVLLVDVINPFDFPGGAGFARRAVRQAHAIARLADRARRGRVPVVYVNDNMGRWRSDIHSILDYCRKAGRHAARITEILSPQDGDHVILKSTLSGFYQTALETMLRSGGVRTVVLAGFATDNCVLFTAADAYMRDFNIVLASDGMAAETRRDHREAIRHMKKVFEARLSTSTRVRLTL
jgi:nicotinamidase-related amidase